MGAKEFHRKGFKITVAEKPAFEAVGFTRPANLDGGSIARFIKELKEDGRYAKLAATLPSPQQIWVCLSDGSHACGKRFCPACDMSCAGFDVRCTVCVEKTAEHDFSRFGEGELFTFSVPASQWADFEADENQSFDPYQLAGEIGYQWNDRIRLHFDNEHEWEPGKTVHFLLPVIPKK
ncbi:MAG: hypothetical protein FWF60_01900 [Oscillospiraceae bacterium]|nr:hypothetical protein [Oscillospiraceae bacterium]